ncbi:T9SS type A sorting domain-containing protein [Pontibacter sp. SGAir0037]|uniref:T9SS type A sorting domain-containing protein n=1 Tax=Pontibacter sp. SGAir0037 TaxID=2571030 RepID=UPI0010CD4FCA|nr:T9SS type A sorting domain-containing protein [Pontibacter sp. SGAir0037]QCR23186.1 hypothetical protein C1N53_13105 [Pontibacter sp. SGAir0037]
MIRNLFTLVTFLLTFTGRATSKYVSLFCLFLGLYLISFHATAQCPVCPTDATVITTATSNKNINWNNTSKVCIDFGASSYSGNIHGDFTSSKELYIISGTFDKSLGNNPAGKVFNCGSIVFDNFRTASGFYFENYGTVSFRNDFTMNTNSTVINKRNANASINKITTNGTNVRFENQGTANFTGEVNFYAGSQILNSGHITFNTLNSYGNAVSFENRGTAILGLSVRSGSVLNFDNYKTLTLNNSSGIEGNLNLNNYASAVTTVNGDFNVNNSGVATITNDGDFTFNNGVNLRNNSTITNRKSLAFKSSVNFNDRTTIHNGEDAEISFGSNFVLANSSNVENLGKLEVKGDFTTHQSTKITNQGSIVTSTGNVTLDGTLINKGLFDAKGKVQLNSNNKLLNYCTFVAGQDVINNSGSTITNVGLFTVDNGQFRNQGAVINGDIIEGVEYPGADGRIQGKDFWNDGTVSGHNGNFMFTGYTVNQGRFAMGADDKITFYDVSRTGVIFDQNNNTASTGTTKINNSSTLTYLPIDHVCVTCNDNAAVKYINPNYTPLPIELISFKATTTNAGVTLQWKTATEIKNDRFEIERSKDGFAFEKIGTVKGAGTSNTEQNYQFTDAKAFWNSDIQYYRLKQIDENGSFEYSTIVFAQHATTAFKVVAMPNPFQGQITISLGVPESTKAFVTITAINGKSLLQEQHTTDASGALTLADLDALSPGFYVLQVQYGNQVFNQKLVKQ